MGHFTVIRNGNEQKVYKDGVLVEATPIPFLYRNISAKNVDGKPEDISISDTVEFIDNTEE